MNPRSSLLHPYCLIMGVRSPLTFFPSFFLSCSLSSCLLQSCLIILLLSPCLDDEDDETRIAEQQRLREEQERRLKEESSMAVPYGSMPMNKPEEPQQPLYQYQQPPYRSIDQHAAFSRQDFHGSSSEGPQLYGYLLSPSLILFLDQQLIPFFSPPILLVSQFCCLFPSFS